MEAGQLLLPHDHTCVQTISHQVGNLPRPIAYTLRGVRLGNTVYMLGRYKVRWCSCSGYLTPCQGETWQGRWMVAMTMTRSGDMTPPGTAGTRRAPWHGQEEARGQRGEAAGHTNTLLSRVSETCGQYV